MHVTEASGPVITIDSYAITKVSDTKFLGVTVDEKLTWYKHIDCIAFKISRSLSILHKLKYKLSSKTLLTLYYCLIYPHLTYCIVIWGTASLWGLNKLIILQKRTIRVINKENYLSHTNQLFKKLNLLKLPEIYLYFVYLFLFKFSNRMLPISCNDLLILNTDSNPKHNLRSVIEYIIPKYRTSMRAKCLKVCGPKHWNSLPTEIRHSLAIGPFKRNVSQFLLNKY